MASDTKECYTRCVIHIISAIIWQLKMADSDGNDDRTSGKCTSQPKQSTGPLLKQKRSLPTEQTPSAPKKPKLIQQKNPSVIPSGSSSDSINDLGSVIDSLMRSLMTFERDVKLEKDREGPNTGKYQTITFPKQLLLIFCHK